MAEIVVVGAAGCMGMKIINLIHGDDRFELVGAVDREDHLSIGADVGSLLGLGMMHVFLGDDLDTCLREGCIVVDFSSADAVADHAEVAARNGVAFVTGVKGILLGNFGRIEKCGDRIPVCIAPNMSVGVNLMFKVLKEAAGILGDGYDVEIIDTHHNQKKGAPSGTAVKMAQIIADALGRSIDAVGTYGRKGIVGARPQEEIAIHAVRAGDIVGEHTVIFGGIGERLEFTHRVHSRDNFALGAIRAALWIADKKPGMYNMQDVLGSR